jgi:hypothetical protein
VYCGQTAIFNYKSRSVAQLYFKKQRLAGKGVVGISVFRCLHIPYPTVIVVKNDE